MTRILAGGIAMLCLMVGSTKALPAAPELAALRADRAHMAYELSRPIAACVAKHDTDNPAFHGCIDWHSAVHGTWALVAYTWATTDTRYQSLIDSVLRPDLLAKERRHLAADPNFEMPYGRAWFLRLAVDYKRGHASRLLDPLADDVAASLIAYYARSPPDPRSVAYRSATWALINLYDYGISRGDRRIVAFVDDQVRRRYLVPAPCPALSLEVETKEFMAICTNWAWLVGRVLPRQEFIPWLDGFLPADRPLPPIVAPASVHQTGLNFSRAWGLWGLYRLTGDERFLKSFLAHFRQSYADKQEWRGEYSKVSHWVAQFGMLDLILTYYDWPEVANSKR